MSYRNWKQDKKIPKHMMVYNKVWVIPKDLEIFMPPDEILNMPGCQVVYTVDGIEYDLFEHEYTCEDD
jgi:hypothetical protein